MLPIDHVSPSALDTLGLCPQKFDKEYIKRLIVPGKETSKSFGLALHFVMAAVARGMPLKFARNEAVRAFLSELPAKEWRTAEKLDLALSHYVRRHGGFLTPLTVESVEQPVTLEIPGIPIPFKFVLDLLSVVDVNDGHGPSLWAVDYKTTSRLDLDWAMQYRNSNQFKGYDVGARQLYPELAGVLVELFHITKGLKSEKGQKGKTQAEIDGVHLYRLPIRYSDFTREEWKRTVQVELRALELFAGEGHFPLRAPTACRAFNSSCAFLDYCASENAAVREQLLSVYETRGGDESAVESEDTDTV
jgi:hypothetical protein